MKRAVADWFVLIVVECAPMTAVKMSNAEYVLEIEAFFVY